MDTKIKMVFLDSATMGDASLEEIASLGDLKVFPSSTREQSFDRVKDCEVLLVNKVLVDKELMDNAPRLRLVCVFATGLNNVDLDEAARRGVPVRNVAGYSTDSVVQTTFMHILSLMGDALYYDRTVKDGTYSRSGIFTDASRSFQEIAGKTLGIIGMGTIGTKVAALARAFGMDVVYYSTSGTSHNTDYPSLSLEELLSCSDVVSIHAPLNDSTRGLLGARELSLMKPSAFLVNAGRGGIVDESALACAIDSGTISGAALDVFEKEPLPGDSPLLKVRHPDRLRFTPHTAWASKEAKARLVHLVAENIRRGW